MPSTTEQVQLAIGAAQKAASGAKSRFAGRAEALDLLEKHVFDRLLYLGEHAPLPLELEALAREAEAVRGRLEADNERFVRRLRRRIRAGRYSPGGLRGALVRCIGRGDGPGGYDALDQLTASLLGAGAPTDERARLDPEMVRYQPTPARQILRLIDRAAIRPDDVFYDLGSGLGNVVLLVALLCGARARGIEVEPAYCEHARACARDLNVPGVEIIQADARAAPFAEGTVFFLYTPFRGALMRQVLDRLRVEATQRPIRVCTYGPCTAEIADERWLTRWLTSQGGRDLTEHEVAVFQASPLPLAAP